MGHVARGLVKHVSPSQTTLWQSVTVLEAQSRGWESIQAMAHDLQAAHPPEVRQNIIKSGIFFTNDPSISLYILGIVAVGAEAIQACDGMGALQGSR